MKVSRTYALAKPARRLALFCGLMFSTVVLGQDAKIWLVPIRAALTDGTPVQYGLVGQDEIQLFGLTVDQRVWLEVWILDWDIARNGTPKIAAYVARIDPSGYVPGVIEPALVKCNGSDAICVSAFGQGAFCGPPGFPLPNFCGPGFIDVGRCDYILGGNNIFPIPSVDLATPNYTFGGATIVGSAFDQGWNRYAGTLVLDVSAGASGTFDIGLSAFPESALGDEASTFIPMLTPRGARITVGGTCPDGICNVLFEDKCSCPTECGAPVNGDGVCECTENVTFPADCLATCGDLAGVCDTPAEDSCNCPIDCGAPVCGDGVCECMEDSFNCVSDCLPGCDEGACCDGTTGICRGPVPVSDCTGIRETWFEGMPCSAITCDTDCNNNGLADASEPQVTKRFGVGCAPGLCVAGTQWSFLFSWLPVGGKSFVKLDCGPLTLGVDAIGATTEFVECVNTTIDCSGIVVVQPIIPATITGTLRALFDVTAPVTPPGKTDFTMCVGPLNGPANACCFVNNSLACPFNPDIIEIIPSGSDCNANGIDDASDIFIGILNDTNRNGIPDECEAIPTVSAWGLVLFTLSLLAGAKVYFGRRLRVKRSL